MEELLNEDNFRLTLKPINPKFENIWKFYKLQQAHYWRSEEIDFSNDKNDFEQLGKNEQYFIKMILAFFAASDGVVNMNLRERFMTEIKPVEAQVCYTYQAMMENIHSEVYSDMLINLISDIKEREELTNAFKNVESVKLMTDWGIKWCKSEASIGHRIIAFAIIEGIFFSGAFAAIYWLKYNKPTDKSIMNGLILSNGFIARDEGIHCDFACLLYTFVNNKISKEEVNNMIMEAVEISTNFCTNTIKCDMIGMTSEMMTQYIKYVSDRLLVALGYEKIFNDINPFPFMETIGLLGKTNFFESRSKDYQSACNENNNSWNFKILDDF